MNWLRMPLNPRIQRWPGQVVWLVGASTGIGRATAELLHERGATVVVSARSAPAIEAFAQQHPGSLALPLDATDRAALGAASRGLDLGRLRARRSARTAEPAHAGEGEAADPQFCRLYG